MDDLTKPVYVSFSGSRQRSIVRPITARRRRGPWGVLIASVLGAATAAWLLARVFPHLEIHAGKSGDWESIQIDWTRTMLGHPRE